MLAIQWDKLPVGAVRVEIHDGELVVTNVMNEKLCSYTLEGMLAGVSTVKPGVEAPTPPIPCVPA